jgi:dolichol-phosphate mannosyltransferase
MTTEQRHLSNARIDANTMAPAPFTGAAIRAEERPFQKIEPSGAPARVTLSLVIPCYNEEKTLEACVEKVLAIADDTLNLELIIVDDCSKDGSLALARRLEERLPGLVVLHHQTNQGKGAALRTGFAHVTGEFVAVQDADLEYDPMDLKRLLVPLRKGEADVVLGSRFLSAGYHRVLYFWHSLGNRFLTLLSNMLTDLNLTDMETCYKVFRREVIQGIEIEENRFGFEPEVVAKIAQRRLRIYEMGVSYRGRTYAEGKKIGVKDGFRALYCILKYSLHKAPWAIQFFFYIFIGGISAIFNLLIFLLLYREVGVAVAAPIAFFLAAGVNYYLSIKVLFRREAKWKSVPEMAIFLAVVGAVSVVDLSSTQWLVSMGVSAAMAKALATATGLLLNFAGRRFIVFPEEPSPDWKPQGGE